MIPDYQCVTEVAVASSRLPEFVPARWLWNSDGWHVALPTTETYDMAGKHWLNTISLLSGGAVRRNSLRCAPFGPPTVSCVLAPARTCLRQAPPTSRGRGLATSAVPHHLTDDMAMKTFNLGKRCKKTSFFTPFQKIWANGVKSGRILHRFPLGYERANR